MPPPREFRDPIPPLSGPLPPARLADPCFNTHKRQNRSSVAASGGGAGGGEERIERAREIQRSLEKRMERRKSQYEDVVANHNQVRKDARMMAHGVYSLGLVGLIFLISGFHIES